MQGWESNPMQTPAAINIGILYLLTPVLGKSMNYSD